MSSLWSVTLTQCDGKIMINLIGMQTCGVARRISRPLYSDCYR
jgi:hypothetical protein